MRVLVIEDDPYAAESTEALLRAAGIVCEVTDLGEDGIELAKLYDFDLVLLDLILPDLDGQEVIRAMRAGGIFDHVGFGFHRYATGQQLRRTTETTPVCSRVYSDGHG